MIEKLKKIIERDFEDNTKDIRKIIGLGIVNEVYEITGFKKNYIARLNTDTNQLIEYKKEEWCLNEIKKLNVNSPQVLKIGIYEGIAFMIQNKVKGRNGTYCSYDEKVGIWYKLGKYASLYNTIKQIRVEEVNNNEFHKNWKARLRYNLKELNNKDNLLKRGILNKKEHFKAKSILKTLETKEFTDGLVHGDLCPRNTIISEKKVCLIDWGTAEINVIPHHEIGLVMLSKEANEKEFEVFLKGFGISKSYYEEILRDILALNFLHRLDKYRWAQSYDIENLKEYEENIKETFKELNKYVKEQNTNGFIL